MAHLGKCKVELLKQLPYASLAPVVASSVEALLAERLSVLWTPQAIDGSSMAAVLIRLLSPAPAESVAEPPGALLQVPENLAWRCCLLADCTARTTAVDHPESAAFSLNAPSQCCLVACVQIIPACKNDRVLKITSS